jgi:uncharacterized protein (DUF433 family)
VTRRTGRMTLTIATDPAPIVIDEHGFARVNGTRVTLDTVVTAFQLGETPEQIALNYDTLTLADIYDTIAYYLRHRPEIDAYLGARKQRREEIRQLADARLDRPGIRERLLTRAAQQGR